MVFAIKTSNKSIQNIYINGKLVGEIAFDASVAGENGKPIIMVSGDDKACSEAKFLLPHVVCCEVKKGMSTYGAMLMPIESAHKLIYDKTIEAVNSFKNSKIFKFNKPIRCRIELTERSELPVSLRALNAKVVDARTYEAEFDNTEDIIFSLL